MKKALLIVLVVVIVLTGIPVLMGGPGMAMCPECEPATMSTATCLTMAAVLAAALAMVIALLSQRARSRDRSMHTTLLAFLLERPPRLA